ncbi:MAG: hypothetical protein ACOC56_02945 [Atribacterota bacterium]
MKHVEVNKEISFPHFKKQVQIANNIKITISFDINNQSLRQKLDKIKQELIENEDWESLCEFDSKNTIHLNPKTDAELINKILLEIEQNPSFFKKIELGYFHPYHTKYIIQENEKLIHALSFVDDSDPREGIKI